MNKKLQREIFKYWLVKDKDKIAGEYDFISECNVEDFDYARIENKIIERPIRYFGEILERCSDNLVEMLCDGATAAIYAENCEHNTTQLSDYINKINSIIGGRFIESLLFLKVILLKKGNNEKYIEAMIDYLNQSEHLTMPQMCLIDTYLVNDVTDKKSAIREAVLKKLKKGIYIEIPYLINKRQFPEAIGATDFLNHVIKMYRFTKKELGEEKFELYKLFQKHGTYKEGIVGLAEKFKEIIYPTSDVLYFLNHYATSKFYVFGSKVKEEIIENTEREFNMYTPWNSSIWKYISEFNNISQHHYIANISSAEKQDAAKLSEVLTISKLIIERGTLINKLDIFESEEFNYESVINKNPTLIGDIFNQTENKNVLTKIFDVIVNKYPDILKTYNSYGWLSEIQHCIIEKAFICGLWPNEKENLFTFIRYVNGHGVDIKSITEKIGNKRLDNLIEFAISNFGENESAYKFIKNCLKKDVVFTDKQMERIYSHILNDVSNDFPLLMLIILGNDDYLKNLHISKEDAITVWFNLSKYIYGSQGYYYRSYELNTVYSAVEKKYASADIILNQKKNEKRKEIMNVVENIEFINQPIQKIVDGREYFTEREFNEIIMKIIMKKMRGDNLKYIVEGLIRNDLGNKQKLIDIRVDLYRKEIERLWMQKN